MDIGWLYNTISYLYLYICFSFLFSLCISPPNIRTFYPCLFISLSPSLFVRSSGVHVVGHQTIWVRARLCNGHAGEWRVGADSGCDVGERRVRVHARCKRERPTSWRTRQVRARANWPASTHGAGARVDRRVKAHDEATKRRASCNDTCDITCNK